MWQALALKGVDAAAKSLDSPPSYATSGSSGNSASFDNSGWNVAFGGSTATSAGKVPAWLYAAGIAAAGLVGLVAVKRYLPKSAA